MNIEQLRDYCLSLPHSAESFPFDQVTLVFKVADKIFAIAGLDAHPPGVNLKCLPDLALLLREEYPEGVLPGYHMNKKHWNTVVLKELPSERLRALILHSYRLVWESLPRKTRQMYALEGWEDKPNVKDFWNWE